MARPIFAHELSDPDFAWLISNFKENHPEYLMIEGDCLPVALILESSPVRIHSDMSGKDLDDGEAVDAE